MNTYRESCNHQVAMYGVNRVIDAFCLYVCKARDCGKITVEVAEKQIEVANDVAFAYDDNEVTDEVRAKFAKIREFNRKHNLSA